MKKRIAIILIFALVLLALAGCGKKEKSEKIGIFNSVNENDVLAKDKSEDGPTNVQYDSLQQMMMALERGDIDYMAVPRWTAEYYAATNKKIKVDDSKEEVEKNPIIVNGLGFMFKEDNKELRDRFNEAIEKLEDTGVIERLVEEYVIKPIGESKSLPKAVKMPEFPGKETIVVAVTGDLPPLDYVDDDGVPAGFNTEFLKEVSELLEINIEFISIDSGARAMSIETGKCDVCFWTRVAATKELFDKHLKGIDLSRVILRDTDDVPEGYITSIPYIVSVMKKVTLAQAGAR